MRNTPTCVGKTLAGEVKDTYGRKHPHVRGEDSIKQFGEPRKLETPPRAWGRHRKGSGKSRQNGNTPTCVGKTERGDDHGHDEQKHPHVRGEDVLPPDNAKRVVETPPRAWGRH